MTRLCSMIVSGVGLVVGATACSGSSDRPAGTVPADSALPAECKGATEYAAGIEATGSNGVTVKILDSNPAPPGVGSNDWTIAITGPDQKPLVGATVKFFLWMPAPHNHPGARDPVITERWGGAYEAKLVTFNMDGIWTVTIQVTSADGTLTDRPMFTLCAL